MFFQAWRLHRRDSKYVPHTLLNVVKTVLAGGLTLLAAADLIYWATRDKITPGFKCFMSVGTYLFIMKGTELLLPA